MQQALWQRLLREPLLHFLLLGGLIFLAYSLSASSRAGSDNRIVVSAGQIENLAAIFMRTRMRPPNAQELQALIADYVREEVYAREATAQGLDRGDPIIRRRLRQKMEYVAEDAAAEAEPTDAQLEALLAADPQKFARDGVVTFRQIYFSPDRGGSKAEHVAADVLKRLRASAAPPDPTALGDTLSLVEPSYEGITTSDIARIFGDPFAAELAKMEVGAWHGPIESGYGLHLIYVAKRDDPAAPTLAQVRDAVLRAWNNDRAVHARETYYRQLQDRYTVVIEPVPTTKP